MKIFENDKVKCVRSEEYNYNFDKTNGMFVRWGKTVDDDPTHSPYGNEILDIEVSTICNGLGTSCAWCYKGNTGVGKNMSLETFKCIIDKIPKNVGQAALGIGDIDSNKDLWDMMKYSRSKGIIPNITINGYNLKDEYVENLVSLCGAVSVSKYTPKDYCYNAVKKLTDAGLKQCNIHQLISKQTLKSCYEVIDDFHSDERLSKLNAIVFMFLKPKGSRNRLDIVSFDEYSKLIKYAVDKNVPFGGCSCQCSAMFKVLENLNMRDVAVSCCESCESLIFSHYINVDGVAYPCSFAEGEEGIVGLDVLNCNDYMNDIWNSPSSVDWRNRLIDTTDSNGCRKCLIFNEVNINESIH